jgi:WD40 repeat protein
VAELKQSGGVVCLAFSPDGAVLASGSIVDLWEGELKVWDTSTYRERHSIGQKQWVNAVAFSPDGSHFAVGLGRYNNNADPKYAGYRAVPGEVQVYNASTMRQVTTLSHRFGVNAVAFSPDGKLLATAGGQRTYDASMPPSKPRVGEVYLWDAKTWKQTVKLEGLQEPVVALAFSPDGQTLAVNGPPSMGKDEIRAEEYSGQVKLFTPGEAIPRKTMRVQDELVTYLAFSPLDASLLVITNHWIALWDPATGKEIETAPFRRFQPSFLSACFSPDGKRLVVTDYHHVKGPFVVPYSTVDVWDLTTGSVSRSWNIERRFARPLAISPDGGLLAMGGSRGGRGDNSQILLWSLQK